MCFALLFTRSALALGSSDNDGERVRVLIKEGRPSVEISENGRTQKLTWTSSLPHRFLSYDEPLLVDGRPFRGEIVVHRLPGRKTIRVINELPLEDYLRGVLPSEMPATWPEEALKAQAVAARSYALHSIVRNRARSNVDYDLNATVMDQVYLGRAVETPATDSAVFGTAGQLLEFAGAPIRSYFHSSCGGMTEVPGNVWGGPVPDSSTEYVFHHVVDSWCSASPYHDWLSEISFKDLRSRVLPGVSLRDVLSIKADTINASGRIESFTVEGTLRTHRVSLESITGQKFRMLVGPSRLRSLRATVTHNGDSWVLSGSGWGHGVGLCQWGARGMAGADFKYREILEHYYPEARLAGIPAMDSQIPTIVFPASDNYSLTNITIMPAQ